MVECRLFLALRDGIKLECLICNINVDFFREYTCFQDYIQNLIEICSNRIKTLVILGVTAAGRKGLSLEFSTLQLLSFAIFKKNSFYYQYRKKNIAKSI